MTQHGNRATATGNSPTRRFRAHGFQLDEDPRTLTTVIVFLVLAVYAFVDTKFTAAEGYISAPPVWLFLLCGALAGIACYLFLLRGAVPRKESIGLAVAIAVTVAIALFPGFLRISELLAKTNYKSHTYVLVGDLMLKSVDGKSPAFQAPLNREYWQVQKAGGQWAIETRRGLFGVWSYRRGPLHKEIEAYLAREAISKGVLQGLSMPDKK